MAILPGDILYYLSAPAASSGFTSPGSVGNSLGKFMSTSQVNSGSLDDIFPDITPSQNAGLQVDYQCVFIWNNTQTGLIATQPYAWIPTQLYTPNLVNMAIGVDPTPAAPFNAAFAQALTITSSFAAPANVTFVPPSALYTSGVSLPDLPPTYAQAIWLQRTATASPPGQMAFQLTTTFTSSN
jgi:hypothetical protein